MNLCEIEPYYLKKMETDNLQLQTLESCALNEALWKLSQDLRWLASAVSSLPASCPTSATLTWLGSGSTAGTGVITPETGWNSKILELDTSGLPIGNF